MSEDDDIDIGRRTWEKASQPIQQDAFREGFEKGHQASFQAGFDEGFTRGFSRGFNLGFINGVLRVDKELSTHKFQLPVNDCPHRGNCVICPSTNEPITKELTANSSLLLKSVEDVFLQEEKYDKTLKNFEIVSQLFCDSDREEIEVKT